jgi:hypothetical protein
MRCWDCSLEFPRGLNALRGDCAPDFDKNCNCLSEGRSPFPSSPGELVKRSPGSQFKFLEDPTIEPFEFGSASSRNGEKLDVRFTRSLSHSGRSMGWVHIEPQEDWLPLRLV